MAQNEETVEKEIKKPEEKLGKSPVVEAFTEEGIASAIRKKINDLNILIEIAAQMKIQTELTEIDITNVDSNCTILSHFVKLSKIL